MAKVLEILASKPIGAIINDKRVLATLKRCGLICDYSWWSYLESHYVYYRSGKDVYSYHTYWGSEINDGELGTSTNPYSSIEAIPDKYVSGPKYKGYKFATKYLDGCFNAYLEMVDAPDKENRQTVNPRMSLWGAVI